MKKITQEQINSVINLLVAYNVGVKDFEAVRNMFDKLEVIGDKVEDKEVDKKDK